jgi:hypothetical protein
VDGADEVIRTIFAGAFLLLLILAMLDVATITIDWESLDLPVIDIKEN